MAEFLEIIKKDANVLDEISHTIDKYNKESFSARSQVSQNAFIQSTVFKEAIVIMGETISFMEIDLEEKGNKIHFLEDKIGIPDSRVVEETNSLDLNKISNKEEMNK